MQMDRNWVVRMVLHRYVLMVCDGYKKMIVYVV